MNKKYHETLLLQKVCIIYYMEQFLLAGKHCKIFTVGILEHKIVDFPLQYPVEAILSTS